MKKKNISIIMLIFTIVMLICNNVFAYEEITIQGDGIQVASDKIKDISDSAQAFLDAGSTDHTNSQESMQNMSEIVYNVLFAIGIIAAIIIGSIIAIKIMTAGIEEKAQYKEYLIPYVMGVVILFGAFGIWKLVVELFQ